jgi:hypothetical protein
VVATVTPGEALLAVRRPRLGVVWVGRGVLSGAFRLLEGRSSQGGLTPCSNGCLVVRLRFTIGKTLVWLLSGSGEQPQHQEF